MFKDACENSARVGVGTRQMSNMVAERWPQESIRRRTVEEIVDMPVSQISERIDEMVALPKVEQGEGDSKKAYDIKSFDQMEDEAKVLVQQIAGYKGTEDQLYSEGDRIDAVQTSISELDANVTRATEIRKKQHAEFATSTVNNAAATNSLKLTVNSLNEFYAPRLHEAAPKAELSLEDRVYVNVSALIQERIVEETVDVAVPQVMEETVEIAKYIPQERVEICTVEQVVDVPVPQIMEDIFGVVKFVSQERAQQRTVEQVVDVLVQPVMEEIIDVMKVVCLERVSERIEE